ncbi:MAG: class I SAM-dependent methyltransferase [Bacteroidota bacterium]
MQQIPAAFSGDIPVYYDSYLGPMFFEPFARNMAERISQLSPSTILELASGTGRLTKLLPEVVAKGASIIASDINPAMIQYGRQKTSDTAIEWMEIDAVTLPFRDHTFDCVVVQFGVMFYSDRVQAFKEAWRVLKPGGHFLFSCWDTLPNNPVPTIVNDVLHRFFPIDTPAFYTVPFSYHDESLIKSDLSKAGFNNITIDLLNLTGYSESAANAAKGAILGTPTITAIDQRDEEASFQVLKKVEEQITEQFGSSDIQVPLQARVVTCKK